MRPASLVLALPIASFACTQPSATLELPGELARERPVEAEAEAKAEGGAIPQTDVPACTAALDDEGQLVIAGQPSGVEIDPDLSPRVRSFPWDHESILLAIGVASPAFWAEPEQVGSLYRVACDRPREWVELVHLDHADFAWAELSVDRRWLYFSYPGVGVLDFAAWDWAQLAPPRMLSSCWVSEAAIAGEDYVFGRIADDALLVYSGGPCGFEAEWEGQVEVIDGIREDELPFRRKRAYVSTVVADAKGRLWVGDGGQCSEAEAVYSRGHAGVWRSDDAGERWDYVGVGGLVERGIVGLWIRADDPRQLLAQAECCYAFAADYCEGGELFASDDGGASWIEVSPRLVQSHPDAYGPVDRLTVDPVAWTIDVHVPSYEGDLELRSRDGGRSWKPVADPPTLATPASREATIDHWHFEPGLEGLVRTDQREPLAEPRVVLRPGP